MYISITYFKLKAWWAWPLFQWHALLSYGQANQSKGMIRTQTWSEQKLVFCTLTHWNSMEAMLKFRNSGKHLRAMRISRKLGDGKAFGWDSETYAEPELARKKLDAILKNEGAKRSKSHTGQGLFER